MWNVLVYYADRVKRGTRSIEPLALLLLLSWLFSACSADTGAFGGGNWQATGLSHQTIRALEVDPNNPQHLYAGDTQGNVFVSTDGAQHWIKHTLSSVPNTIVELAFNVPGKKLYAATAQGLFVSTDSAQSWIKVNTASSGLPEDRYTALAFDTNSGPLAYVGTAQHGLFVSTNDGVNWSAANSGLPSSTTINSISNAPNVQQLWIATPTGVYRSTDHGASWQSFSVGFSSGVTVNTVVPASASGGSRGILYAGSNRGFYLSRDGGKHWAMSSTALLRVSIYRILVDFRSAGAATVYVSTNAGAFRTDDNGLDWRSIAVGLPRGVAVYAIVIGATNNTQLYVGANNVYVFPGTSGSLSPSRIPVFIGVVVFFVLLYFVARRGLRGRRARRPIGNADEVPEQVPPASTSPER